MQHIGKSISEKHKFGLKVCYYSTYICCSSDANGNVTLEQTSYFAYEDDGFVEICAVMTTLSSTCPLLNGNITLSITVSTATGMYPAWYGPELFICTCIPNKIRRQ